MKIQFNHVGRNEGCVCDQCGQYIQNVWSVQYANGATLYYGIDCFSNILKKSNFTKEVQKRIFKAMRDLEIAKSCLETEISKTEDTDEGYQVEQAEWNKQSAWHGEPWLEYHKWMVEEFWPFRIQLAERELNKYSKFIYVEDKK